MRKTSRSMSRLVALLRYAFFRTVWIDVLSLLYSVYVYVVNYKMHEGHSFQLMFLCLAKYHGFSVSLSLLAAHWSLCYSLHEFLRRPLEWWTATCRCVVHSSDHRSDEFAKPCHVHVVYAVRFVYSMTIHSIVHVVVTHPLQTIIVKTEGRFALRQLWFTYRWTITGYLLFLLSLFLLMSGRRLTRFVENHVRLRNCHVAAYVLVVGLFLAHSSNYPMLVLSILMIVSEWMCTWIRSMHLVTIESVTVFRESRDTLDVVMEFEFTCERLAVKFRCGDYVRVYAPIVSWFEMHSFSLIPIVDRPCSFRLLIRTVGRWTKRLYTVDRERLSRMWICGPFHNRSEVRMERLFPRTYLSDEQGGCCFFFRNDTKKETKSETISGGEFSNDIDRRRSFVKTDDEFRHDHDFWYDDESFSFSDGVNTSRFVAANNNDDFAMFDVVSLNENNDVRDDCYASSVINRFDNQDTTKWSTDTIVSDGAMASSSYWVDSNFQLCLICTGISITRHLSILTHLVSRYRSLSAGGVSCCDDNVVFNGVQVKSALPCRIKLIWSIGRLFDVNLAVSTLDNLQRCLDTYGWQSLLTYDIFVSKNPSMHDHRVNERFCSFLSSGLHNRVMSIDDLNDCQSMLVREQWSRSNADRRLLCDSSILFNLYSSVNGKHWRKTRLYRERDDGFAGSTIAARDPTVSLFGSIFSNTCSNEQRASIAKKRTENAFSLFHANTTFTLGKRVSNWDRVVLDDRRIDAYACYEDIDHFFGNLDSCTETVIVLTTGVESIKSQIRRIVETRSRVKLYVEQLW